MIRMVPFIYSATIAYIIEFGDRYARFFFGDGPLIDLAGKEVFIETPYVEGDLFELCFKQAGDVIRIVHPNYAPRKLTRTTAYSFSLDEIEFTKGPFLIRNDVIDPDVTATALMASSVTALKAEGTLTCQDASANAVPFFVADHVGTLFRITQPRAVMSTSGYRGSVGVVSAAIDIKGSFKVNVLGTDTPEWTLDLQRNENEAGWDNFRTYVCFPNSPTNVEEAFTEDADNVQYRAYVSDYTTGYCKTSIISNEPTQDGVVRVTGIISSSKASIKVLSKLASTNATRKWAEGAWSALRGYPTSVTFFEERCAYSGMVEIPEQVVY